MNNLKSKLLKPGIKLASEVRFMERCKNPWNKECKNDDIEVYIMFRGEKLPICRRCWSKIAIKDLEW